MLTIFSTPKPFRGSSDIIQRNALRSWRLLHPDVYVIGAGQAHSVREFVQEALGYAGMDWQKHVKVNPRYLRPLGVERLVADASKARAKLRWEPQITFEELVAIMVDADMEAAGVIPPGKGKIILESKLGRWHQWWNCHPMSFLTPGESATESSMSWGERFSWAG
jgi:hypothetical protein